MQGVTKAHKRSEKGLSNGLCLYMFVCRCVCKHGFLEICSWPENAEHKTEDSETHGVHWACAIIISVV